MDNGNSNKVGNIRLTRMVDNDDTNGRIHQDFSFNEFLLQGLLVDKRGRIEEANQEVKKEISRERSSSVEGYDESRQVIHPDDEWLHIFLNQPELLVKR